jgi:hypothetical protein
MLEEDDHVDADADKNLPPRILLDVESQQESWKSVAETGHMPSGTPELLTFQNFSERIFLLKKKSVDPSWGTNCSDKIISTKLTVECTSLGLATSVPLSVCVK